MPEQAVTQVERVLALKAFSAFRNLSPQELAPLAEYARPRIFKAGECVLRQGMPVRTLYFILQGRVELERTPGVSSFLGPQDVLGGLAVLSRENQTQNARAVSDLLTLQLHRDDVADVFEDNFAVLFGVLCTLARGQISVRQRLGARAGFPEVSRHEPARVPGELELVERLFFLRQTMNFAESRVESLADLAQETTTLRADPGETFWEVGSVAEHCLILIRGVVSAANDEQRFEFGPGSVVGGIDSIAGEPRWFRASAETPITALCLRAQHLLDVIEDDIDFGMDTLRVFARTLRELQARLSEPPVSWPLHRA